jgi:hypothetical protein
MTNKELMQEYVSGMTAGDGINCYILGRKLYTYHEVLCEWDFLHANTSKVEFRVFTSFKQWNSKTSATHRNLLIRALEAEGYKQVSLENNIATYRKDS